MSETTERAVRIAGEVELEAILHLPAAPARAGVANAHPHSRYGGSLHNPQVAALARALATRGLAAVRINLRGVGQSGGEFGGGKPEAADLGAALAWLGEQLGPGAVLGVAGYSFGAAVAVAYAGGVSSGPLPRALALVAPPMDFPGLEWAAPALQWIAEMPVLAVVAEHDEYAPPAAVGRALKPLGARGKVLLVPGTDHFFPGKRQAVANAVAGFFAEKLAVAP
ncbi:MAG: alpha/beta hydrolase [Chloroflexota bacterium]